MADRRVGLGKIEETKLVLLDEMRGTNVREGTGSCWIVLISIPATSPSTSLLAIFRPLLVFESER